MKIAIISDSHDNMDNVKKIINKLNNKIKPDVVIHCGDLCAPFVLKEFAKLNSKFYHTFGNVDGDHYTLMKFAKDLENIDIVGALGEIKVGGKKIAFTHFPFFARGLAFTKDYDLVCHGHVHLAKIDKINNTLLVCPGSIYGNKENPKFAVYDTESNEVKIEEV